VVGLIYSQSSAVAPPLSPLKGPGVKLIRDLGLAKADEEKVFSGNARRLLNL